MKLIFAVIIAFLAIAVIGPIIGAAIGVITGLAVPIGIGAGSYYIGRQQGRKQIGRGR